MWGKERNHANVGEHRNAHAAIGQQHHERACAGKAASVPRHALSAIPVRAEAEAIMHIAVLGEFRSPDMHTRFLKLLYQTRGQDPFYQLGSFGTARKELKAAPGGFAGAAAIMRPLSVEQRIVAVDELTRVTVVIANHPQLIVFHSLSGGTRQMAEAVALGAQSEGGIRVRLLSVADTTAADILHADGYVFATPENLGAMAGRMKDFFDRTYYAALDRINGRPFATLICAGSDGHNAARQLTRIVTGWRLRSIAEPIIVCTHAKHPRQSSHPKSSRTRRLPSARSLELCGRHDDGSLLTTTPPQYLLR